MHRAVPHVHVHVNMFQIYLSVFRLKPQLAIAYERILFVWLFKYAPYHCLEHCLSVHSEQCICIRLYS